MAVEEFQGYLARPADLAVKTGTSPSDPRLLLALRRAGGRFEGAIQYPVLLVEDDLIYLAGGGNQSLLLPARPVVGTPSIKVDGVTVTDFSVGRKAGIIRRRHGVWPDDLDNVEVTYTHGWPEPPEDIQDAVLEQAETLFHVIVAFQARAAGSESVSVSALAAVGVTQRWSDTVERYSMAGDRP